MKRFFNFQKNKKNTYKYINSANNNLSTELATREKVDWSVVLGQLPDQDDILATTGESFLVYRQIMTDSQVRACVNSRKAGTLSLLWEISDKGKNKNNQAKLLREIYADLDIDNINAEILNAPMFGFQPIEVMWGKVGNYIVPVDLVAKNQEWFCFDSNSKLRLLTVNNAIYGEELPDRKFLTPTYNDINNKFYNPYGDRVLSSCFWPVTFKKSTFKWWVTFTEKYGMPYLIGKMPRSTMDSERSEMLETLKAMVMDAVAVITDDSALEFHEPAGKTASGELFQQLITETDHAISKAILGQTLTTDGGGKGGSGSYALGKVHAGVREDIVYSDKKIVERTHNQLIRWIWELNFGTGEIPTFLMYEQEDVDKTLAERDSILVRQGVKFTKDYYMKEYGLDEADFEVAEPND